MDHNEVLATALRVREHSAMPLLPSSLISKTSLDASGWGGAELPAFL